MTNERPKLPTPAIWISTLSLLLLGGCTTPLSPAVPDPIAQESPYRDLDSLAEGAILHVPTGIELTKDQFFHLLEDRRIIYVGEVHVNMRHHQAQLEILRELERRFPGRIAVGMEMFQRSSQPVLDRWSRGKLDEKSFVREWHNNWTEGYGYYKEIFQFIREKRIPLIALNATDEEVRRLAEKGLEGLTEAEREALPELDDTDSFHREAMEAAFGGHAHGEKGFGRFYQTMLLWDETMARTISDYLAAPQRRGRKMVVFTGGFHVSYGFGIPRRVFRRLPEPYAIVLPHTAPDRVPAEERPSLLMEVPSPRLPLYIADFVWAVGYEDMEDRPVRLGVQIEKAARGVIVKQVTPNSPAARAGIQAGDLIVSFGGEPILEPFDLSYAVSRRKPGDRAPLKVLRNNQTLDLESAF